MIEMTPTLALLARAIDVSALKQSVYATNVANAGVPGYRRLEVSFEHEIDRISAELQSARAAIAPGVSAGNGGPTVVATHDAVKLDEEIGLMAKNALRYQVLLGAVDKSMGALRLAIREGRE